AAADLPSVALDWASSRQRTCTLVRRRGRRLFRQGNLRQYGRAPHHAVTWLDFDFCRLGKNHVSARAKLDQAYSLPPGQRLPRLVIEDDPPGQYAGNLFEHHGYPLALQGHNVLLVVRSRRSCHGVAEMPLLVYRASDDAAYGRAVHMD